ncbi:FimD/PapC N-terminal domain-containing protein [Enterobacter roggenkampii]|jgi:outer membrane usher protein|uniref:FimD/PapC N-terminal domain-containing protein n=1 Tax=Enterobacter roggenkampii TaxID=1812935 RepID=UPI002011B29E|nr:FimD/PapC N-terminal domain-containing protein [Enterobacter roggenkampii]URR08974.1 FimD/PapC N-terminal domain-containing protein [Enterobacter roggenkampii]
MSARHNKYRLLKKAKSTLGQIMILALCISGQVNAETEKKAVNFSRGFMNFYDSGLDLSQFDGVDKIQPGDYKLEVFSNLRKLGTWPISFIPANNTQGVNACMTPEMIIRFDVDTSKLPENWKTGRCLILETLVMTPTY